MVCVMAADPITVPHPETPSPGGCCSLMFTLPFPLPVAATNEETLDAKLSTGEGQSPSVTALAMVD